MMKKQLKTGIILCFAGLCCLTALTGCSPNKQTAPNGEENQTQTAADGQETAADTNTGDTETGSDTQNGVPEVYKPSDVTIPSLDLYEEPFAGMNFILPDSIKEKMESKEVAMLSDSDLQNPEQDTVGYVMFTWNNMTKKQQDATVKTEGDGFSEWADGLQRLGALGVYHSGYADKLDQLTKCTEHKELGKSKDGAYTYYLSIAPDADKDFAKALEEITIEIIDMQPLDVDQGHQSEIRTLGEFSVQDVNGVSYTNDMFRDKKLTMINVFATWCTPCINEIPDLEKLHKEMEDQGVNIVGIVLDASGQNGEVDEDAVQKAKILQERTKATYPFLIPDAGLLGGRLKGIDAVPETFFVDENGNIIGNTYTGSHSFEDWKKIVQTELNNFEGEDK